MQLNKSGTKVTVSRNITRICKNATSIPQHPTPNHRGISTRTNTIPSIRCINLLLPNKQQQHPLYVINNITHHTKTVPPIPKGSQTPGRPTTKDKQFRQHQKIHPIRQHCQMGLSRNLPPRNATRQKRSLSSITRIN